MSAQRMTALSDVVPGVVSRITGEPVGAAVHDADALFLRACAAQVRVQDIRVAMRLDGIAERFERAIRAGQLIPVTE